MYQSGVTAPASPQLRLGYWRPSHTGPLRVSSEEAITVWPPISQPHWPVPEGREVDQEAPEGGHREVILSA